MWIRFSIGMLILTTLAVSDLIKNGKLATRWREYAFLAVCVAVAICYGIANDQITSRISWEYFYYGKNLATILGPDTPPNPAALHRQALRVGAEATWWVGLVIGATMLIANNPSRRLPQLTYRRLLSRLGFLLLIVACCAVLGGFAGTRHWLDWIDDDFRTVVRFLRPKRFMAVYGIHLGGYAGGVLAIVWTIASIWRERRSQFGVGEKSAERCYD